jgi:serine/threonine protein phosphatase PrpC
VDVSEPVASRCDACDALLVAGDRFCEECGARVGDDPAEDEHVPEGRVELDLGAAAAISDQGRVHQRNEDAFYLELVEDAVVGVVCDGISTAASGDVAARTAARAAGAALADAIRGGSDDLEAATVAAVAAANAAVAEVPAATRRTDVAVPSCTLVCAVCRADEVAIGWVGDSRAYWIGPGDARQLTLDDSWAGEQVAAGRLSPEEAARDRRAHAITRWVGADAPDGPPGFVHARVRAPGRLILCSDGVWNYTASPGSLATLLDNLPAEASPAAVARTLAEVALERGGHDNITAVVVDRAPPPGDGA